jgi:hypothetical protein
VRRLTPRECERLQGFSDIKNSVKIVVWSSEQQKNYACAATSNLRWLTSALNAGAGGSLSGVIHAEPISSVSPLASGKRAAVNVLYDLDRKVLQLRNPSGSNWSASIAAGTSSSPLSMPTDAFAHLLAIMPPIAAYETHVGKAVSPQSRRLSSLRESGSALVHLCGQEIAALVKNAVSFTAALDLCTKSITSEVGSSSPNLDMIWETWSCCVAAAISGFIPALMQSGSSFEIVIETVSGYTLVPNRGKPAADGPRYKALGNSMAVPVMRWIGRRIDTIERLYQQPTP